MTLASPPRSGPRLGSVALLLAWLILLGVLAAAAGYVFMTPQEPAVASGGEETIGEARAKDEAPEAPPPEGRPAAVEPDETEILKAAAPDGQAADTGPAQAAAPEAPEIELGEPKAAEQKPAEAPIAAEATARAPPKAPPERQDLP